MTQLPTAPDPRPAWLRGLVLVGAVLLLVIGLPMTVLGVAIVEEPQGPFALCFGLLLVALGVAGAAREAAEGTVRRHPPSPRLDQLETGETALFLPRATAPSVISAASLAAVAVVTGLGALFALVAGRAVLGVVLLVVAALCLLVARPGRARQLTGGLWYTPRRIVHSHDGVRWELAWEDVHGAVPSEPMAVLVHQGRTPQVQRSWVAGRHRGRAVVDGVPVVEARYLAGGAVLASFVIEKALADPTFRAALGTPESLPPGA
ncbi:MAG: hypothetical protein JWM84_1474 [Nocardioides sp.]|jgi:hypothetical protein|nr:hypothetical protein [Nocardioides sp.]